MNENVAKLHLIFEGSTTDVRQENERWLVPATVKSAARYFEAAGLPAIVRVPSKEYHPIARACDLGAEGIMISMVSTAAEANAVVNCMK